MINSEREYQEFRTFYNEGSTQYQRMTDTPIPKKFKWLAELVDAIGYDTLPITLEEFNNDNR